MSRVQTGWRPLVPEEAFSTCLRDAVRQMRMESNGAPVGAYLEFGVSRGTSMACAARVFVKEGLDVHLYGFDSFQGMPRHAAKEGWTPGAYRSTRRATERYLRTHGADFSRITLIEGWFEETLTMETWRTLQIGSAGVIMVDCDTYSATRQALTFCEPLIQNRTVIIFDDWGAQEVKGERGEREAFEWFLSAYPSLRATPIEPSYAPRARMFMLVRGERPNRRWHQVARELVAQ